MVSTGTLTGWRQDWAATATSGASVLPRCATSYTRSSRGGPVVEVRCWVMSSRACWSATSTEPTTCTRGRTRDVGPTCCGTSTERVRSVFPEHEGFGPMVLRGCWEVYDQAQAYPGPGPELPETVRTVPAGEATAAVPRATMVHLPAPPGQRYADAGAMPEGPERFLPELFTSHR